MCNLSLESQEALQTDKISKRPLKTLILNDDCSLESKDILQEKKEAEKRNFRRIKSVFRNVYNVKLTIKEIKEGIKNGTLEVFDEGSGNYYNWNDYWLTIPLKSLLWIRYKGKLLYSKIEFDSLLEKGYYEVYTQKGAELYQFDGLFWDNPLYNAPKFSTYEKVVGAKRMNPMDWFHWLFRENSFYTLYKYKAFIGNPITHRESIKLCFHTYDIVKYEKDEIKISYKTKTFNYEITLTENNCILNISNGYIHEIISGSFMKCLWEVKHHSEKNKAMFEDYHKLKDELDSSIDNVYSTLASLINEKIEEEITPTMLKENDFELYTNKGKWDLETNCYEFKSSDIVSFKLKDKEYPILAGNTGFSWFSLA